MPHPDSCELCPEARSAHLGKGALELATRGGDAPGNALELELEGVFALDYRDGLMKEVAPASDRGRAAGHVR